MEEQEKAFNLDLANWALEHFPKLVTNEMVDKWKKRDKMPNWLFHEDRLKVYGVPVTLALKLMNVGKTEFCKKVHVNHNKVNKTWFASVSTGPDIYLIGKTKIKVMEFFSSLKRLGELAQRKPLIKDIFFFLEYNEPDGKVVAFHFMGTVNHVVRYSDSQVVDGPFTKDLYKGRKIEDFVTDKFVQVRRSKMRAELRKINRLYTNLIPR